MKRGATDKRVLAVDLHYGGFGSAVLEGPKQLLNWDVRNARTDKNCRCLKMVKALIDRYRPETIVVEDPERMDPRRSRRLPSLITEITALAKAKGVTACTYSVRKGKAGLSESQRANKPRICFDGFRWRL